MSLRNGTLVQGIGGTIVDQVGETGTETDPNDLANSVVQDTLADIFDFDDIGSDFADGEFGGGGDFNFTNDFELNDTSGVPFATVFQAVRSTQKIQDRFRFFYDRTHNLSAILDDSGDQTYVDNAKEYLWSLIFLGAVMLFFFLAWGVIIVMACCGCFGGRKRVGFLSGRPFVRKVKHRRNPNLTVPPDGDDLLDEDDEDNMDDDEDDDMDDPSFPKREEEALQRVSFVSAIHEEDEEDDDHEATGSEKHEKGGPVEMWDDDDPKSVRSQSVIPMMKSPETLGGSGGERSNLRENSALRSNDTLRDEPLSTRPKQAVKFMSSHDTLRDEPQSTRPLEKPDQPKEKLSWAVAVAKLFHPSDFSDNQMVPQALRDRLHDSFSMDSSTSDSDAGSTVVVDDAKFLQRPDASEFLPKRRFPKAYDHWGDPWKSRATKTRLVFITSGVICVTFGILMVAQGITNLQTGINTVHKTTTDTFILADTSLKLIRDALSETGVSARNVRDLLAEDLDNSTVDYCPGDPNITSSTQELINDAIDDVVSSQIQSFEQELQTVRTAIIEILDEFDELQEGLIGDFEGIIEDVADYAEFASDETDNFSFLDWQSLIVLIPYTVFPTLLVTGALLALYDVSHSGFQCFLNYIVLPIFILMTIVAFTFSSVMVILAGVNADFCLPGGYDDSSPDTLVLGVIQVLGYNPGSFIYDIADWYISQCETSDPFSGLRAYQPEIAEGLSVMNAALVDVQGFDRLNELEVYCNREFTVLEPLLLNLIDMLQVLLRLLVTLLELIECGRLIPIYTKTVYSAGCEYSPRAVFWVWSGTLILGFFGMVMITLRSAMKSTVILEKKSGSTIASDSEHFMDEDDVEEDEIKVETIHEEDEEEEAEAGADSEENEVEDSSDDQEEEAEPGADSEEKEAEDSSDDANDERREDEAEGSAQEEDEEARAVQSDEEEDKTEPLQVQDSSSHDLEESPATTTFAEPVSPDSSNDVAAEAASMEIVFSKDAEELETAAFGDEVVVIAKSSAPNGETC